MTTANTGIADTILSIDLGRYKRVACISDHHTREHTMFVAFTVEGCMASLNVSATLSNVPALVPVNCAVLGRSTPLVWAASAMPR